MVRTTMHTYRSERDNKEYLVRSFFKGKKLTYHNKQKKKKKLSAHQLPTSIEQTLLKFSDIRNLNRYSNNIYI